MKKIVIQGTSRTATKLYRDILNKVPGVYLQHEINFDFRFKRDINAVLKKHNVYKNKSNIRKAIDEIYNNPFFDRVVKEYPEKEVLIDILEQYPKITWSIALTVFLEEKSRRIDKNICGAKNPVHFSYTPKLLRELDNIKVLYLLRDPRAMYASELYQKGTKQKYSNFPQLKIRFLQRWLILLHTSIEWMWAILIYKRVKSKVVFCSYEQLVNDPMGLTQNIFNYCDLEYKPEYLNDTSVMNSSHAVEKKGISSHGLDKWKSQLNWAEKVWFKFLVNIMNYKSYKYIVN